ncbi:uncharacterized protein HD556DRAFT_1248265 [Suillus plorans]|uniref:Uncharacterized protein n=1 Tax=Suillus plorans TaxID=116603 RepID=A0A9P7ACE4_9AGAM|nr:uncharacterized protein HD556DRAFT_1248265 [Suillus plorans]KAG1786486.1 hypothetical protein HD556DRAFT_1248265 [Suillus plorans]
MKYLDLGPEDSMLVITSAGGNALHYAIAAHAKRIHCVDMNHCQGHLLELKLAAVQTLEYEDFFSMFGNGHHPKFHALLDSKIAPLLSSIAYQFWHINDDAFSKAFYLKGYSGWALWLARIVFSIAGVSKDVEALCNAGSMAQQEQIWREKLRPALLNPIVIALLKSAIFCWNALGVPLNQRRMVSVEGSMYEFIRDARNPLPSTYSFKDGAYFYPLTLLGHYTPFSCPEYLTCSGFEALKANSGKATDAFRLHTDSIYK